MKKDSTEQAAPLPMPLHHDNVLRAVTTIAQTLIDYGVAVNVATATAIPLAKIIQADVDFTIEEISQSITKNAIELPSDETGGETPSHESAYDESTAELSEQTPPVTKHDASEQEEKPAITSPNFDDTKQKELEVVEQTTSKVGSVVEIRKKGRFDFTSLMNPEAGQQTSEASEEKQQAPAFTEEAAENRADLSEINKTTSDLKKKLEKLADVKCKSCGKEFTSDEKFCPHCSTPKPETEMEASLQEQSRKNKAETKPISAGKQNQICLVCNSPVRLGKNFCTHCGAIRCKSCKSYVERGVECSNCHAPLMTEAVQT